MEEHTFLFPYKHLLGTSVGRWKESNHIKNHFVLSLSRGNGSSVRGNCITIHSSCNVLDQRAML